MRFLPRFAAVAAALLTAAPALTAQGALSIQGFGYPGGELSTRALGTGGALTDFDANSPVNPAALLIGTRALVYMQYDPEFRWITGPGVNTSTVTTRFPLFLVSGKLGQARVSLSYSSFLDRTWTNTYRDTQMVGALPVPSTVTALSQGGIADVRAAISYTFSDRLTIGAGLHVFPGENRIVFGRSFPTDTISYGAFSQVNSFNYSGAGLSLGVLATPVTHLSLGASGRYGFSMHVHQGDSTTLGDARVPNRFSLSAAYDGVTGTLFAVRYGTESWSAMKGLGSNGLTAFDATEFSAGLETAGPRIGPVPMAVRLGYRERGLPFGVGVQQVHETQLNGGLGIPFAQGRAALDISVAHTVRNADVGLSEKGWILSFGIAIKPY